MPLANHRILVLMWIAWSVYWWALSFRVKTTARRESLRSQFAHVAPLAIAALLLFAPGRPLMPLGARFVPAASSGTTR